MSDSAKTNLRAIWLVAAALSLTLPVFVPSFNTLNPLSNIISVATLTMFVLSFPMSLLAVPLSFIAGVLFGIDTTAIGGEYLAVCLMFALGAVQWFWLVPRLWRRQTLVDRSLRATNDLAALQEADNRMDFEAASDQTPLEKVFKE
jgi:hypothetical protein